MSKYEIIYRRLENYTGLHQQFVLDIEPKFLINNCYFINVNLHPEYRMFVCDGKYLVELPETLSGIGLTFSERVDPQQEIVDIIHNKIFF